MKIAIMQPYFLPYIGYFQLINAADIFVIYDNIEYTKKGWINRNRFLQNGKDATFSIPLKKDSDFLDVRERFVSKDFNRKRLLAQIKEAYKKAPCFDSTINIIERMVMYEDDNLFNFIFFSVKEICKYLGIGSKIVVSSTIEMDHTLKSQEKVIAICKKVGAQHYINAIGGLDLYSAQTFIDNDLQLNFIKSKPINYPQFAGEFVSWLSIIDVMMFNSIEKTREYLCHYSLI